MHPLFVSFKPRALSLSLSTRANILSDINSNSTTAQLSLPFACWNVKTHRSFLGMFCSCTDCIFLPPLVKNSFCTLDSLSFFLPPGAAAVPRLTRRRRRLLRRPLPVSPGEQADVSRGRVPELPHERDEEVRRAGLAQERVVEELGGRRPLGGVADQHLVQKAVEARRNLDRFKPTVTQPSKSKYVNSVPFADS